MLTIKLISAGSVVISQVPGITIGLKGSEIYKSVVGMTAECNPGVNLDVVQLIPETLDDSGRTVTDPMMINVPRADAQGEPVAVLITDLPASELVDVSGTNYQFVYEADEAMVLNENGITIHHIK